MSRHLDVVVVGAGAVGLMAALELVKRGANVTLLERGPAPGAGCSSGNAGIVGASYVVPLASPESLHDGLRWLLRPNSPFSLRPRPDALPWLARFAFAARSSRYRRAATVLRSLALESFAIHQELDAAIGTGLEQCGLLCVYETEQALARARTHAEERINDDVGAELVGGEEARSLCPQLRTPIAGAILTRTDAHCDPGRFLSAIAAAASKQGAHLRFGVEVFGIARRGRRAVSVLTTAGELGCDRLVVAAGVWSGRLARELGLRAALQGGKGYHVEFTSPDGGLPLPVYFGERRMVATPLPGRVRITGMLQLSGTSLEVDQRRLDTIARDARERLPDVASGPVSHAWRGLRPCTPDGLPLIGRARVADNAVLATGHGMWGLQLAPVTGRLVAEIISGSAAEPRLPVLRPDRFNYRPWPFSARSLDQ